MPSSWWNRNRLPARLKRSGCLVLPVLALAAQMPAEAGERWSAGGIRSGSLGYGGGVRIGDGFGSGGRIVGERPLPIRVPHGPVVGGRPYPTHPGPHRPGGHGRPGRFPVGIGHGIVVEPYPDADEDVVYESIETLPAPRRPGRPAAKPVPAKQPETARPLPPAKAAVAPVKAAPPAKPAPVPAAPAPVKAAAPAAPKPPAKAPPPPIAERPERPIAAAAAIDPVIVPDEVLCEIQGDVPAAAVDQIARGYGLASLSSQRVALTGSTLYRYRIVNRRSVEAVVRTLRADPRIASAQPNYVFRLQGTAQAGLAAAQYAVPKLQLGEAHKLATGAAIPIAVIDSGVDASHPELAGAVTESVNLLDGEAKPHPHGTAVAGIIGARAYLTGAAPRSRILAIRAFSGEAGKPGAAGTTAHILRALVIAQERGARIVNLSFSGPSDPMLAKVLQSGRERGTIFVAAAGNGGPKAAPSFPALDPNVIAVTATDSEDRLYPAANRGAYVTLAAPGVDILAPAPSGAYGFQSGTSMAAAYVSSLAALLLEKNPALTPDDVRRILTRTAQDLGPAGPDPEFGAGRMDALAGVKAATPATAQWVDPVAGASRPVLPVSAEAAAKAE